MFGHRVCFQLHTTNRTCFLVTDYMYRTPGSYNWLCACETKLCFSKGQTRNCTLLHGMGRCVSTHIEPHSETNFWPLEKQSYRNRGLWIFHPTRSNSLLYHRCYPKRKTKLSNSAVFSNLILVIYTDSGYLSTIIWCSS
jgi:hypothetical protein